MSFYYDKYDHLFLASVSYPLPNSLSESWNSYNYMSIFIDVSQKS